MKESTKFFPSWHWSIRTAGSFMGVVAVGMAALELLQIFVFRKRSLIVNDNGGYPEMIGILLVMTGIFSVVLFIVGRLAPPEATPDGLVASVNGWGRKGLVPWDDIQRVSYYSRWPIRLLELTRRDGTVAYRSIPKDDVSALTTYVRQHAGDNNPLTTWLASGGKDV